MAKASEHIEQLLKMTKRAGHLYGTTGVYNVGRIRDIFKQTDKLDEYTAKALRIYFLISLVTNIEVFFRGTLAQLIDHGEPFISRSDHFIKELKFDANSIRALQGREITLGKVISLVPSFQSLEAICGVMTAVIGTPFLSAIATVQDRWEVEVMQKHTSRVIGSIDDLARDLSKLFELRHIAVHELPRDLGISEVEIARLIDAAEVFLKASYWYVSELLDPGAPLQQQPMNALAGQRAHDANAEMEKLYATFRDLIGDRSADLDAAQAAWSTFREATANFEGNEYLGGTIRPLIYYTAHKSLTEERAVFLRRAIQNIEDDPRYT